MTSELVRSGRVLVIAEAGVNHNGSVERACALVDAAAAAGADAVKFQTFLATDVATDGAVKAAYQVRTTGAGEGQLDMLRRLELSPAAHIRLVQRARDRNIAYLSTPFDLASLTLLTDSLGLQTLKISSGEITNAPFLLSVAMTGRRVILSTGMATLGEVEAALGVLAFGWSLPGAVASPGASAFAAAFASDVGQATLRDKIAAILHCTTEYPAAAADVNLRAMDSLAHAFRLPVGLSDHTMGIHIPVAAVARGARVIEKHFTLDRTLPGPDHAASLEPEELRSMIAAIRDVEAALGDGVKRPTPSEWKNRDAARRSLVAAAPLRAGDRLGPAQLSAKRPGNGVSPMQYWDRLGRTVARDYAADEPLDP